MPRLTIRQEGSRVLLGSDGKLIADMPWDAALNVSHALRVKAKAAEEIAKADQIVFDQALLQRVGANVGLSNNLLILREAGKEVAWNSTLRKNIPSIGSQEQFGAPTITQTPPRKRVDDE